MDKLRDYLNGLTKDARHQFISACRTSEGYLRKAISTKQRLGSGLCISIDRESRRAVTCEDLRPDVDWSYLRTSRRAAEQTDAPNTWARERENVDGVPGWAKAWRRISEAALDRRDSRRDGMNTEDGPRGGLFLAPNSEDWFSSNWNGAALGGAGAWSVMSVRSCLSSRSQD